MLVCKLEVIETGEKFRKLDYQSTNWMLYYLHSKNIPRIQKWTYDPWLIISNEMKHCALWMDNKMWMQIVNSMQMDRWQKDRHTHTRTNDKLSLSIQMMVLSLVWRLSKLLFFRTCSGMFLELVNTTHGDQHIERHTLFKLGVWTFMISSTFSHDTSTATGIVKIQIQW